MVCILFAEASTTSNDLAYVYIQGQRQDLVGTRKNNLGSTVKTKYANALMMDPKESRAPPLTYAEPPFIDLSPRALGQWTKPSLRSKTKYVHKDTIQNKWLALPEEAWSSIEAILRSIESRVSARYVTEPDQEKIDAQDVVSFFNQTFVGTRLLPNACLWLQIMQKTFGNAISSCMSLSDFSLAI